MKTIKVLAFLALMVLSFQSLAQVHLSIGLGGRIGHGYYNVQVNPYHHYRNYDRYQDYRYYYHDYPRYEPIYDRVAVYCLDDYGYEYFCGYKLIRRER